MMKEFTAEDVEQRIAEHEEFIRKSREHGFDDDAKDSERDLAILRAFATRLRKDALTGKAALEKHPGWVFVDRGGCAWGIYHPTSKNRHGRAPAAFALRPFRTREEAVEHGDRCPFGCVEVREWRKGDRVPPMPEGE